MIFGCRWCEFWIYFLFELTYLLPSIPFLISFLCLLPICFFWSVRPTIGQRWKTLLLRRSLRRKSPKFNQFSRRRPIAKSWIRTWERRKGQSQTKSELEQSSKFPTPLFALLCYFQPFLLIFNVCDYKPEQCYHPEYNWNGCKAKFSMHVQSYVTSVANFSFEILSSYLIALVTDLIR